MAFLAAIHVKIEPLLLLCELRCCDACDARRGQHHFHRRLFAYRLYILYIYNIIIVLYSRQQQALQVHPRRSSEVEDVQ